MARDRLAAARAQARQEADSNDDNYSYPQPPASYSSQTSAQQASYEPDLDYYSQPSPPYNPGPTPAYGGGSSYAAEPRPSGLPSGPRTARAPINNPSYVPSSNGANRQQSRPRPQAPPPVARVPAAAATHAPRANYSQPSPKSWEPSQPYRTQQQSQPSQPYQVPLPPQPAAIPRGGGRPEMRERSQSRSRGREDEKMGSQEAYELKSSNPKGMIKAGDVAFESMAEFRNEIDGIDSGLNEASEWIQAIRNLHNQILNLTYTDDARSASLAHDLRQASTQTRNIFTSLKSRIQVLAQGNANLRVLIPAGQSVHHLSFEDVDNRERLVGVYKAKFKRAIQVYQDVEKASRGKTRAQLERQGQIAGLRPDEIDAAVRSAENGNGGAGIFSQALMQSNRSNQARAALGEAQSRAEALAQIERTLLELAQMFNDMDVLVEAQGVQIVQIEQTAVTASDDVGQGVVEVKQAVKSAKSARKKRWWCFGILVTILIVVFLIVFFKFILPIIQKNQKSSSSSADSKVAASANNNLVLPSTALTTSSPTVSPTTSLGALPSVLYPSLSASAARMHRLHRR